MLIHAIQGLAAPFHFGSLQSVVEISAKKKPARNKTNLKRWAVFLEPVDGTCAKKRPERNESLEIGRSFRINGQNFSESERSQRYEF